MQTRTTTKLVFYDTHNEKQPFRMGIDFPRKASKPPDDPRRQYKPNTTPNNKQNSTTHETANTTENQYNLLPDTATSNPE